MPRARSAAVGAGFRALNRVMTPPVKAGFGAPGPVGPGLVVLETVGRRSGLRRQVPLAAVRVGDRLIVSTVRGDSKWITNLEAEPAANVLTCGGSIPVTGRVRRGPLNVAVLEPSAAPS